VLPLDGGRFGFVVGDVMGRGVRAAAVMGQLRATVRALAVDERAPSEVLARTGQLLPTFAADQLATSIYAVVDPAAPACSIRRPICRWA
jgi:serine phosphatase RsbU (regulator of sigma subunit)